MTRPVTLSEPHFSQHTLNKYASLMAQGNGYLGLRASHEEDYTRQTRGMYLAGLYHRAGKGEINELVNLPDVVGMEIAINGEVFSLSHEAWQRELDFASGELRRNVVWRTSNGSGYTIASRRFVSADQLPLIALEITITPLDADASVLISTGIDATQTNHGRQHLDETQVRVFGQHLMQILKQADVVMLNYMLPEQFSAASCLANLQFYEPRTIHDSSLSKAIHGIVAARCGLLTQSYQFWREGTEIDLGADPHSCDDGIHAAATGAIWLGAIQGFAGVSVRDGELHLNPALPEQWQQLSFPLFWQGCELQVTLDAQRIAIRTSAPVSLRLNGQLITVAEESVFCLGDFILPFNGTATKHQEDE
ncbi:glycoside hydrolase family 65 protein [Escherichia coli]|nr:glycoside hydrolase family 65 protein [Escherichia coli]